MSTGYLAAGYHNLTILYWQGGGGAGLVLSAALSGYAPAVRTFHRCAALTTRQKSAFLLHHAVDSIWQHADVNVHCLPEHCKLHDYTRTHY